MRCLHRRGNSAIHGKQYRKECRCSGVLYRDVVRRVKFHGLGSRGAPAGRNGDGRARLPQLLELLAWELFAYLRAGGSVWARAYWFALDLANGGYVQRVGLVQQNQSTAYGSYGRHHAQNMR